MPTTYLGTYYNCYAILEQVRLGISEYSEGLVRGLVPGTHHNKQIINEINKAQLYIYAIVRKRMPGFFISRADIVGVNSVYALPWDYGSNIVFKTDQKLPVHPINVDQLKTANQSGTDRRYYQRGQSFVLDKDGITKTYELWYYRKPRRIHMGRFAAGGTGTCTLSQDAQRVDDYYNGMIVESVDGDWHDPISDYTAARAATLTNAAQVVVADAWYGIVPELPDFFQDLISERAILTLKKISPIVKEKPKADDYQLFEDQLAARIRDHMDIAPDVDWEQVFGDFGPRQPSYFGIHYEN